jgi:hypothetical protein
LVFMFIALGFIPDSVRAMASRRLGEMPNCLPASSKQKPKTVIGKKRKNMMNIRTKLTNYSEVTPKESSNSSKK